MYFEVSKIEDGGYEIIGIYIMSEFVDMSEEVFFVIVLGLINVINVDMCILNISWGLIEKWDRFVVMMDFIVVDNIEIVDFNVGDNVIFIFEVRNNLVIIEIYFELNE